MWEFVNLPHARREPDIIPRRTQYERGDFIEKFLSVLKKILMLCGVLAVMGGAVFGVMAYLYGRKLSVNAKLCASSDDAAALEGCTYLIEHASRQGNYRRNAFLLRARHYMRLKQKDQALADETSYLNIPLENPTQEQRQQRSDIFLARALLLSGKGQHDLAVNDCGFALELIPSSTMPYIRRAAEYQKMGHYDLAQADLNAFQKQGGVLDQYGELMQADIYGSTGKYDASIALYKSLLARYPKEYGIYTLLAGSYFMAGNTTQALSSLNQEMAGIDKSSDNVRVMITVYGVRGSIYYSLGDFQRAFADAGSYIALAPDKPEPYLLAGMAALALNKPDPAFFTKAIALGSNDMDAYFGQGLIALQRNDKPAALAIAQQMLAVAPNTASTYTKRAALLRMAGEYQQALDSCDKALSLDSASKSAYGQRGFIHLAMKDWAQAKEDFSRYPQEGLSTAGMTCYYLATEKNTRSALAYAKGAVLQTHGLDLLLRAEYGLPYVTAKHFQSQIEKSISRAGQ